MKAKPAVNDGGAEPESGRNDVAVERWRSMVLSRVRRHGFTDIDADRVADDILDAWSQFAFDSEKANGAKPETVLIGLIGNRCKTAMRGLARGHARDTQYGEMKVGDKTIPSPQREISVRLDVREALSRLSPRERFVCEALAADVPEQRIADQLDVNWYGLKEIIDGIRSRFAALGLHEWLEQ